MVWSYGVDGFHAVDNSNNTLYIAATNRGLNYFTDGGMTGHKVAVHIQLNKDYVMEL